MKRNRLKCLNVTSSDDELMKTLRNLEEKTVSINDYIMNIHDRFRAKFLETMNTYSLSENVVKELKEYADEIFVVVFSAQWCKDCAVHVPVLFLLADKTGLNVRVFGGLKKDVLNPKVKWRIPPSPSEIREFEVDEIPHIAILDKKGVELGKIVEGPAPNRKIEEEILQLVKQAKIPRTLQKTQKS